MLQKNQIIELHITDLNNLGFGVAHVDGMTVFVKNAVDGETVKARVIAVKKTYAIATLDTIISASSNRIEPLCKVKGCGGCAYQHISYKHELELKKSYVESVFKKAGLSVQVEDVETAKDENGCSVTTGYRNKAQYPVEEGKNGEITIGFYGAKSHRVVEAADCSLQHPFFQPIVEAIRSFWKQNKLTVYDEETGKGLLRHIYLRIGQTTGEILLTIVLNGRSFQQEKAFVELIHKQFPAVVGILLNVNTENTNVICGDEYRLLAGKDYLQDRLGNVLLNITAPSFYQVNHEAAELLYAKVKELADLHENEQVMDLYCGAGSIGLSLSDSIRQLIGIEIEPSAVECAKENARQNHVENAFFFCGDATSTEKLVSGAKSQMEVHPDLVVLDPPRKGCTEELLEYLCVNAISKIVYVSCNPDTLARDAVYMQRKGYLLSHVTPFDLFPRTGHVETVCLMSRKE